MFIRLCFDFLFCFRFVFLDLTARAKFVFFSLHASLLALRARDNINNHFAAVHTGLRIDAMSKVSITLLIARYTGGCEPMMRTPLRGLGSVTSHSDYHSAEDYTDNEPFCNGRTRQGVLSLVTLEDDLATCMRKPRAERRAMKYREACFSDRFAVRKGAIPFMLTEFIFGKVLRQAFHKSITGNLRNDGGE